MRFRPKPHRIIALAFLVLAAVVYSWRPTPPDMSLWKPLTMLIQLKVGIVQTPEFTAGLDEDYFLFVESERGIDFERLECLLGMAPERPCMNVPEAIEIDWKVLHAGELTATGSSGTSMDGFYSDTVARKIGHFSARKGQRYSVVLDIRRDGGELNTTRPTLLVQTYPGAWKDAVVGFAIDSTLRSIGIAACTIAALLTLILTPLFRHLRRHLRASAAGTHLDTSSST